jgi:hypothetical protein
VHKNRIVHSLCRAQLAQSGLAGIVGLQPDGTSTFPFTTSTSSTNPPTPISAVATDYIHTLCHSLTICDSSHALLASIPAKSASHLSLGTSRVNIKISSLAIARTWPSSPSFPDACRRSLILTQEMLVGRRRVR